MPGEHFCTHCEENVSKHKGTYTKLYFDNFEKKNKAIINVVCPTCREEDEDLDKVLTVLEDVSKPVETFKGARKCIFCGERIKRKEKSLRAEFRYNGSETRADACEKCLESEDYPVFKGAKPKKANPNFDVTIVCGSAAVCESFKKPGKDRSINCGNVCVNIEGELYCRKAHPGSVKVYRERWALPPSRRQMLKIWKDLAPMMSKYKERILEEGEAAEARPVWTPPETKSYKIVSYPLSGVQANYPPLTFPFFAIPLTYDSANNRIFVLEPVEEEKI